ncbi:hypothetical protein LINPERHAP2_LOCUS42861 [Linum perenne]
MRRSHRKLKMYLILNMDGSCVFKKREKEVSLTGISIWRGCPKIQAQGSGFSTKQRTTTTTTHQTYKYCKFLSRPSWGTSSPDKPAFPRSLFISNNK